MALVTKEQVKTRLKQLGDLGGTAYDALLDEICLKVEDIVELYLGFTFDGYGAASTRVVYGAGTPWLPLPPHELGSVTLVHPESDTSETDIEGYAEEADGTALYFTGYNPYGGRGWLPIRYVVTAEWGYGDWPLPVKEVGLELACNIFTESKTGHYSDIQGVTGEGGSVAVGYTGALTKRQKMVLDMTKRKYQPLMVA